MLSEKRPAKILTVPAAAVLFLFVAAAGAFAAGKTPTHSTFEDIVTSVGPDTITIQTGRNAGLKITHVDDEGSVTTDLPVNVKQFKIDSLTVITVDGLPGTLADIKAGMIVNFSEESNVASSIDAHTVPPAAATPTPAKGKKGRLKPPPLKIASYTVLSITSTRITVGQVGAKMARAYYISPTTTVTIDGATASLAELHEGMKVTVSGDSTTADQIAAYGDE